MKKLFIFLFFVIGCVGVFFVTTTKASAATYYISSSFGSDSNSGTTKTSPWAHAPGMATCTGNCAAHTPGPGDQFIFYGCDVWGNSNFQMYINWSGTSGSPIYYGVDPTWSNGPACNAGGTVNTFITPTLDGANVMISSTNGNMFDPSGGWSGHSVTIGSTSYTIQKVISDHEMVVTPNPGNQTGVTFTTSGLFNRPRFDFGNALVAGCSPGGGTACAGILTNGSYVTIDNIEMAHFDMPNALVITNTFGANLINWLNGHNGLVVSNDGFYDWTMDGTISPGSSASFVLGGTGGNVAPVGNIVSGSSMTDYRANCGCVIGGGFDNGGTMINNVISNVDDGIETYYQGQIVGDNLMHDFVNSTDPDNHGNSIHLEGCNGYVYGNIIYNMASGVSGLLAEPRGVTPTGIACNAAVQTLTTYTWDNVMFNLGNQTCFEDENYESPDLTLNYVHYNDTCVVPGGSSGDSSFAVQPLIHGTGTGPNSETVINMHVISAHTLGSNYEPFVCINSDDSADCETPAGGVTVETSLAQTPSTAATQGYAPSNYYAPTSGGDATVGAGTILTNLCSGLLAPLCKDVNGNARPSASAWDIGAYQFSGSGDTTPPTVSVTSPANNASVSGTISVSANASDNVGVASVQFRLDGANLGSLDTSSPYSVSWNTTGVANGTHVLTAIAKDAAGNQATSASVTVTVNNATAASGNIYIAENQAGADNGADCNDAYPVSFFNTASNWGTGSAQIGPGTTVHLCGTISTQLEFQKSGASGNPITILWSPGATMSAPTPWQQAINSNGQSYFILDGGTPCGPSVSASACNGGTGVPNIQNTNNGTQLTYQAYTQAINLTSASNIEIRNMLIANMYVRAQGDGTLGKTTFTVTGDSLSSHAATIDYTLTGGAPVIVGDNFTITGSTNGGGVFNDNETVRSVGNGTFTYYSNNSATVAPASDTGSGIVSVDDPSQITGIYSQGTGPNISIHDNKFHDIGWVLFGGGPSSNSTTIYNNDIYNFDHAFIPQSSGDAFNVSFHDNHVHDPANWDDPVPGRCGMTACDHHDGVHAYNQGNGTINGLNIYNNLFDGNWGHDFTAQVYCQGGTTEPPSPSVIENLEIYNNVFAMPAAQNPSNGLLTCGQGTTGYQYVKNNTFIGPGSAVNTFACFRLAAATNMDVENNLFINCGSPTGSQGSGYGVPTFTSWQNNVYEGYIGIGWGWNPGESTQSFSTWQSNCGCDTTGSFYQATVDVNPNTGVPNPGSAVIGVGANLTSLGIAALDSDTSAGDTRTPAARPPSGAWTVGAYTAAGSGDTTPPSVPTNLSVTGTTTSTASLSWSPSTDNVGVAGYKIYRGGNQVGTTANTSYTDSGLTASTTYSYTVAAYDAAGNTSAQSGSVSSTTKSSPDTTPPTVSVTSPANNASVSGTVSVTANASDNVGVTKVSLYIDGTLLSTDTAAPYNFSWSTGPLPNGTHTLSAKAYDAAGNVGTSANVTVTVANSVATTLSASLSVSPASGIIPLPVSLTAVANGTATGTLTYFFYCNRSDTGTNVTTPTDLTVTSTAMTYIATNVCNYETTGNYTAKVIIEEGSALPAQSQGSITANPVPVTTGGGGGGGGGSTGGGGGGGGGGSSTVIPPSLLTSVTTGNITDTSAEVTVLTSEPASIVLSYGPTTNYGITTSPSPDLTTTYINLVGLTPATVYDLMVQATPEGGSPVTSVNYLFTTTGAAGATPTTPITSSTTVTGSPIPVSSANVFPSDLTEGDTGNEVLMLQTVLQSLGYFPTSFSPTDYFGNLTEHALLLFQRDHDLNRSGFLDLQSQALMQKVVTSDPSLAGSTLPAGTVPAGTTSPTYSGSFTSYLTVGSRGAEVTALQNLLFQDGDYPQDIVTGYFGLLTQAAVQAFQAKYGIVSSGSPATTGYGAVGPRTRGDLNEKE